MISRTILPQLIAHLSLPEITVLLGPRQVGKSTLMGMMRSHLEGQLNPNTDVLLSYNLDLTQDMQLFEDQQRLIDTINLTRGNRKATIFIDEVQRIPDTGSFLKGIYDQAGSDYKLVISGSSALEIKQQVSEALTGRKRIFRIRPVNFIELLALHYPESDDLERFAQLKPRELAAVLEEYLIFGGYPRVVVAPSREEKILLLGEIYESYLQKDIVSLLQIDKVAAYTKLTTLLAGQIGNLVNVSELANTTGVTQPTVSKYLDFLAETFVISLVRPFSTNERSELTKMPKVYFHDLGLRNFALQRFGSLSSREDLGALFENLVFNLLDEFVSLPRKINFWRTKSGAEVDFILSTGGTDPVPLEVKASTSDRVSRSRSLQSFVERYHPTASYVVNLGGGTLKDDNTASLPFYQLPGFLGRVPTG